MPTKWYPLPWFIGALLLVVLQYRRTAAREVIVDEDGPTVVVTSWLLPPPPLPLPPPPPPLPLPPPPPPLPPPPPAAGGWAPIASSPLLPPLLPPPSLPLPLPLHPSHRHVYSDVRGSFNSLHRRWDRLHRWQSLQTLVTRDTRQPVRRSPTRLPSAAPLPALSPAPAFPSCQSTHNGYLQVLYEHAPAQAPSFPRRLWALIASASSPATAARLLADHGCSRPCPRIGPRIGPRIPFPGVLQVHIVPATFAAAITGCDAPCSSENTMSARLRLYWRYHRALVACACSSPHPAMPLPALALGLAPACNVTFTVEYCHPPVPSLPSSARASASHASRPSLWVLSWARVNSSERQIYPR
ncbi:hypothetical protein DENSPDRAFT_886106 [Dentipellis sp. KUC8613]|nr:hypothetical protein DENSPDRAFT_886106 [Dentipellis sp. KUC8613]